MDKTVLLMGQHDPFRCMSSQPTENGLCPGCTAQKGTLALLSLAPPLLSPNCNQGRTQREQWRPIPQSPSHPLPLPLPPLSPPSPISGIFSSSPHSLIYWFFTYQLPNSLLLLLQPSAPLLRRRRSPPLQDGIFIHKWIYFSVLYLQIMCKQYGLQDTLVDLLGVAGRRPFLPMVVCCSSRDELDAVCSSVSGLSFISLSSLVIASNFCLFW